MAYVKPQSPLKDKKSGDYFYPLTTADQVVMKDGSRLNSVFKSTVKKDIMLLANNWTAEAPYTQTITLDEYINDLDVDANVKYSGILDDDKALNKAASCITYIKKYGKNIIFSCLENKPEIDIPIEIEGTCSNSIATVGTSEKIDLENELAEQAELIGELQEALQGKMGKGVLNFSIVGGASQPINPEENTIWVQTDDAENIVIEKWSFGAEEPVNPIEGMVWIVTGVTSEVKFDAIKDNDIQLYPISAKQYTGGAWVDMTVKIYQSGAWVDWWNGEIFTEGVGPIIPLSTEGYGFALGSTYTTEYIYLNSTESDVRGIGTEEVRFDGYTSLEVEYQTFSSDSMQGFVAVRKTRNGSNIISVELPKTTNRLTKSIDISSLDDGVYYIVFYNNNRDKTVKIYNVKLMR